MFRLKYYIQTYKWGCKTTIREILGEKNFLGISKEVPIAEIWMGAHPNGPSLIYKDNKWHNLIDYIEKYPDFILGKNIAQKFNKKLPFLFKILSAKTPLSLQVHPNQEQARLKFNKNNKNYKDPYGKPELVCALTEFWALNGFRDEKEIEKYLNLLKFPSELIKLLKKGGIKEFFRYLYNLSDENKLSIINKSSSILENLDDDLMDKEIKEWIKVLKKYYPKDISIFSPILLNIVKLNPLEAMYIPPNQLHSYLYGTAIELMSNSDNVIRAGLTYKNIDLEELIEIVDFSNISPKIITPSNILEEKVITYLPYNSFEKFKLERIYLLKGEKLVFQTKGVEILIVCKGKSIISNNSKRLEIKRGDSILLPGEYNKYTLVSLENTEIYKASTNL